MAAKSSTSSSCSSGTTYDLNSLPESKDIVIHHKNLYHLVTRPTSLVIPVAAEDVASHLSDVSDASPLKVVTPEQAIESMGKLLTFDERFVYSCDGIRNLVGHEIVATCGYCLGAIRAELFHRCHDCHLSICDDCLTKEIDDLYGEDEIEANPVLKYCKESLLTCRTYHDVRHKTVKRELLTFNPTDPDPERNSCDDCDVQFTGMETKWFDPLTLNLCETCANHEDRAEMKLTLKQYTPGMTFDQVLELFDMVKVTSESKELVNNFGSLLNWVPVLEEPNGAIYPNATVGSDTGIDGKHDEDDDHMFTHNKFLGGSIMVNCNPESTQYGKVAINLINEDVELWFSLGDKSLKEVITGVEEMGGLKRYLVSKRIRDENGKLWNNYFGFRYWTRLESHHDQGSGEDDHYHDGGDEGDYEGDLLQPSDEDN